MDPAAVRAALASINTLTFWGRLAWDVDGRSQAPAAPIIQRRAAGNTLVFPPEIANGRVQYPLGEWPRP